MITLSVQRGCMSANGQRLCLDHEGGPSGCHHLGPWMNKIGDLLSWPDVIHTFPHSSQWWTRCPLVALLTLPVRVYLMASELEASGGVVERCISFVSREDPRSLGGCFNARRPVELPGALLDSAPGLLDGRDDDGP